VSESLAEFSADRRPLSDRLGRIAKLLEENGIDPEDVGRVKQVSVGDYEGFYKDKDGEAHVVELRRTGIVLSPKWAEGPDWPVVQQAAPCVVRPARVPARAEGEPLRAVVLPDPQFGFRRYEDGTLDPFHDEAALAASIRLLRVVRPDLVILLGDVLDLAEFSRFVIEASFALTTQAAIDRAHRYIAEVRAAVGADAEIRMLEGNHDRRIQLSVTNNAKAAFGLRQAGSAPETWPVMSVPHLLRLDELGVTYVDGYPAGITWINDNLACVHGEKLKMSQVVDDERVSIIQGHTHRISSEYKTRRTRDGAKTSLAFSPGCLCRTDGAVPSTKGSTDSFGRAVMRPENWQTGAGVVTYEPGDGQFAVEAVPIFDGSFFFRGRHYPAA
jgi:hypothetical protein